MPNNLHQEKMQKNRGDGSHPAKSCELDVKKFSNLRLISSLFLCSGEKKLTGGSPQTSEPIMVYLEAK